jgi:hypothetical protein
MLQRNKIALRARPLERRLRRQKTQLKIQLDCFYFSL